MSTFNWKQFLGQWSRAVLQSSQHSTQALPPEVVESGWLGYPGATEEQIARVEARLGVRLPPSYREFLKVSNGWRHPSPFVSQLWSTQEIERFAVRHQDWIDHFIEELINHYLEQRLLGNEAQDPEVGGEERSEEAYSTYGEEQDCRNLRVEHLQTAIEISQKDDSSIYLLNPQVVTPEGEWEAWFFGDWLPGADRYRSFQEMMQAEYENFLEIQDD